MYFMTTGVVTVCWLSSHPAVTDRWSPQRSIHDIWFGEPFHRLKKQIQQGNLHTFCNTCEHNIRNGRSPLARVYDTGEPVGDYPQSLELELSNSCNLECVMCQGKLSSSIRKNRERKPPLPMIYTDAFVDQMEEFIPHLRRVRFSGGEPTRHKIMYQIFERIEKLKPTLPVTITTNATTFGPSITRWFDRIHLSVGVSLDSLTPEIYEAIRLNAKFDKVMEHTLRYVELTRDRGRPMTIQMNPMRMNWHETPAFVRFCNQHHLWLSFNTVQYPRDLALWTLPRPELEQIYHTLRGERFENSGRSPCYDENVQAYRDFVEGQIRSWAGGVGEQ
jgi:MoaA/NifB/PqqE/SkfB family radical SAM enzyme